MSGRVPTCLLIVRAPQRGFRSLILAAERNHLKVVELLLDRRADVDAANWVMARARGAGPLSPRRRVCKPRVAWKAWYSASGGRVSGPGKRCWARADGAKGLRCR